LGGNDPYNFDPGSYFTAVFVPWLSHTKSRLELLTEKLEKLYQLVISTTLRTSTTWRTISSFLDPARKKGFAPFFSGDSHQSKSESAISEA
jgi:hypothetical protein